MRSNLISVLALCLSAMVGATILSPSAGAQWEIGQPQQITWDSTGLGSTVSIHLVPAGATSITTIISQIALSVSNTGSFTWTPDASITVETAEIIIVDMEMVTIISSVFEFIRVTTLSTTHITSTSHTTSSLLHTTSSLSHTSTSSHNTTLTSTSHMTSPVLVTSTRVSLATSTVTITGSSMSPTTHFTTTQVTSTIFATSTTHATTTTISVSLAVTKSLTSFLQTTTTKPFTTSISANTFSLITNTTAPKAVNSTPTAATFHGGASSSRSSLYGAAIGSVVGLVAMLLL